MPNLNNIQVGHRVYDTDGYVGRVERIQGVRAWVRYHKGYAQWQYLADLAVCVVNQED